MALDSPVVSDKDSLVEEIPLQTEESISRGTTNYSTFTRKRPVHLSNSLQRKKRQSLMSPQSIPNLDSDDLLTPDFAMTQSMYEPLEKRKQQAKMEQNSRLLNLLASEKISQAAKDRKLKEMKKRAIEQRKRNEEKQKLAEERRLRMLADQEAKKKRILDKIHLPSPMTGSCYGNMNRSIMKQRVSVGIGFIDKRPVSSTGKIFGFGSSSTREVCEKPSYRNFKNNENDFGNKRNDQSISRMCTSQIITNSTYNKERKSFLPVKDNTTKKPLSVSNLNISNYNKSLIKSKKIASSNRNESVNSRVNLLTPSIPEIKRTKINTNINGISKMPIIVNESSTEPVKKSRARSTEKDKSSQINSVIKEPRSRTTERNKPHVKHMDNSNNNITIPNKKPIQKIEKLKVDNSHHEITSTIKISVDHNSKENTIFSPTKNREPDFNRKQEVRFEEKENVKETDINLLSESSISLERRRPSTSNLTEEEYKQRIAFQRKLAKEKRKKEQEEKELTLSQISQETKSIEVNLEIKIENPENIEMNENNKNHENHKRNVLIVETETIPIAKQENDLNKCTTNDNEITFKTYENNKNNSESTDGKVPSIIVPEIETPNPIIEMSTSTEMLDRIERKKRLESIMSRIKKPIGGSTENVAQHISSTTLQDMLNKGHLSGMSKTAAILMRNSHPSSELSASSIELNGSDEKKPFYSTDEINSKISDDTNRKIIQESRGSCDGQEDVINPEKFEENLTTKSNLMENLVSNSNKPYFSSWQEKYSDSCSLDVDDDDT